MLEPKQNGRVKFVNSVDFNNSKSTYLENPVGSGGAYRIQETYFCSINGTSDFDLDVEITDGAEETYHVIKDLTVSAGSTFVPFTDSAPLYLPEGFQLRISTSTSGNASMVLSYKEGY